MRFSSVNSEVVCCFTHKDSIFGPKNLGILCGGDSPSSVGRTFCVKTAGHEGSVGNFLDPTKFKKNTVDEGDPVILIVIGIMIP